MKIELEIAPPLEEKSVEKMPIPTRGSLKGIDWTLGAPILELGQRVSYHHLCAVMRGNSPSRESLGPPVPDEIFSSSGGDPAWDRLPDGYKTLWLWPNKGEATIIGLLKKMIGQIWAQSSGGYDSWTGEYDYDSGGSAPLAYVPIYELRLRLHDRSSVYAPVWGVTPQ